MGARIRGVAVVGVVLLVGAFLGSTVSQWWDGRPVVTGGGDDASTPVRAPAERVRVEVLNGGGRSGMARAATDLLRDGGFDVVYYGNADSFGRDSSVVLDRAGRPELARHVARALGIERVRSEPDPNLYLEVSVVLGERWEPAAAPVRERSDAEGTVPAWWDIRRFFPRVDTAAEAPGRMADPPEDGAGGAEPEESGG